MEETVPERRMIITDEALVHLDSMRKWTMFLAVMGFIGSGFMVLMGLFFAAIMRTMGPAHEFGSILPVMLGIFYVILGAGYSIPSYFLLRFSNHAKDALTAGNDASLNEAFRYLRTFFVFISISVIAIIALYIMLIIGAILFGIFAAMHGAVQSRV